ncbi:hypothetical protein [Halorarius litoreus]|uniref:hypothetical protein n=1 Tax=Halorarius litoreus TaxID=2962676 RepID=UPI0020CF131B|nr:hypothetical protein [Halorarius litoreus]
MSPITRSPRLVGRPLSAAAVVVAAALLATLVAREVAAANAYLRIEHALPTYDGSMGAVFLAGATALVVLAGLAALVDAGVLPALSLAAAPVFGWAVNHYAVPVAPHYAVTYPVEVALLYGVAFGTVGYLVGRGFRHGIAAAR